MLTNGQFVNCKVSLQTCRLCLQVCLKLNTMKPIIHKILDVIVYIFCGLFAAYIIINFA